MAESKAIEQANKKIALVDEIDETIKSICKKIKDDDCIFYGDTIKALAALVEARARLN